MPGYVSKLPYLYEPLISSFKSVATARVCCGRSFDPWMYQIWDLHGFLL